MLNSLTSQGFQFYSGTRYKKWTDNQGDYFQYEELVAPRKSYGQMVNNLIAIQGRYTIKTNWDLGFEVGQYIVDKKGRKWIIEDIVSMEQEVNPQTAYFLNANPDTDFVLSLVRVENALELK